MKTYLTSTAIAAACLLASCGHKSQISLLSEPAAYGEISESVTATGTLESVTSVDVGTQVTGIINKLYVDFNSEVKEGQLIAELEKTVLQSELNSAEATVKSAEASYNYAKTNYDRDVALHARQLISDYEFETSRREYQVALQSFEKAKSDRVKAAKNLNYAEIYSPIDGIVISRDVEVGQTVVSSMTVANLFTIANLDHMQVVADVDEADIGNVRNGQKVRFTVDAYPDDTFEGTVTQVRLSPTTESNVVTYDVIVSVDNPDHKLIPGLTANLTILTMQEDHQLLIPLRATRFTPHDYPKAKHLPKAKGNPAPFSSDDPSKRQVWVVEGNALSPRVVTIGASNGQSVAVTSGLKEGDVVAVEYKADMPDDTSDNSASAETSPFAPKRPGGNRGGGGPR
ncbi:MAG: efflux RND transporter periplasmic adaptor subunit [Bacteroides sp.]|nr:efflux RND transporter periplasmic adaptor subunit [Bacteroides sp.]